MQQPLALKSTNKFITVLIHFLVWALLCNLLFIYQPLSWGISVPYQLWIKQGISILLLVFAYYFNSFVLVPRFLLKDQLGYYFALVLLLIGVVFVINYVVDPWLNLPKLMDEAFHHHGPPKKHDGPKKHHEFDIYMLTVIALVLGISTSITAIQKWQHDQRRKQELEQERTESELSFLKAQINPHFFFNTLNNIYALTVVNVEQSREAIHKLSRMMRYLLYETEHDTTLLSKEIGFIKDYIDLMKLRLTEQVTLTFDVPQDLNNLQIAPMLFLPFVENAFKHGISATQKSDIFISVKQTKGFLDMTVANNIFEDQPGSIEGSGIGLANTRRRLDLLYPGKYMLEIINDNSRYNVKLKLQLA